jgi:hypothetical protein
MNIDLRGHEIYVRTETVPDARARIRAAVGGAAVHEEPGNPYDVVLWDDFRAPEALLQELTRELSTEALWLVWQKQADSFAFQRWVGGEALRRLAYGVWDKERIWEQVDGEAEPWEGDALFPLSRLERQLRVSRLFPDPAGASEEEVRRIWQERRLVVDSEHPRLVAMDAALVVARHYRLPGWTL